MVYRLEDAYFQHLRRLFSLDGHNEPAPDKHRGERAEGREAESASATGDDDGETERGGGGVEEGDDCDLEEDDIVFGVVSGKAMYETRARAVAQTWMSRRPTGGGPRSKSSRARTYGPLHLTHTYIYGDEGHELLNLHASGGEHTHANAADTRTILPVPVPPTPEHAFLSRLTWHDDFFSSVPKFVLALCDMHQRHPGAKVWSALVLLLPQLSVCARVAA